MSLNTANTDSQQLLLSCCCSLHYWRHLCLYFTSLLASNRRLVTSSLVFMFSTNKHNFINIHRNLRQSQWPGGLRRGFAVARLLGPRVRIPPEAWMSVSWECCLRSRGKLCDGLITHLGEFCVRVWSSSLDNVEAPAHLGLLHHRGKTGIWNVPFQWRIEGGSGCSPPPPEIPKALQNRAKLNPICENF